jgi:hypothetical protein
MNLLSDAVQGQLVAHGGKLAGGLLVFSGLLDIAASIVPNPPPRMGIAVHGLQVICTGSAMLVVLEKQKHASDLIVSSEAEKRRMDPHLDAESVVPAIQKEINTQVAEGLPVTQKVQP